MFHGRNTLVLNEKSIRAGPVKYVLIILGYRIEHIKAEAIKIEERANDYDDDDSDEDKRRKLDILLRFYT